MDGKNLELTTLRTMNMRMEIMRYCRRHDYSAALKALSDAARMHSGQRRFDKRAFMSHPLAVAMLCITIFSACGKICPCEVIIVALLHDACENSPDGVRPLDLSGYSGAIRLSVAYLTINYGKTAGIEDRKLAVKRRYFGRLHKNFWPLLVKAMYRYHNLLTIGNLDTSAICKNLIETRDLLLPEVEKALYHYCEHEYWGVLQNAYLMLKELNERLVDEYAEELLAKAG